MLGPDLEFVGATQVRYDGRVLTFFGGNDYHRLSRRPEVLAAADEALRRWGLNTAGSRCTTGNHAIYRELEQSLAEYLGAEDVLVVSSGYVANLVAVQALADDHGPVFAPGGIHPSLVDAAASLGPVHTWSPVSLSTALGQALRAKMLFERRPLIVMNGVEANTGELAPLAGIVRVGSRLGATVLVDDAHGAGTLGPKGQGTHAECGLERGLWLVQTGTLSKAFGAFGGFVAGSASFVARARERSGAFIGSTPAPIPAAAAALRAIQVLRDEPELVASLQRRSTEFKARLRLQPTPSPIASVAFGNAKANQKAAERLLDAGIYPNFVDYPGCPPGGHFRLTLSSAHTQEEVDRLVAALTA